MCNRSTLHHRGRIVTEMVYLLFIGGLALLLFGGDQLVRGGARIAETLGVPHIIVGLSVVAFATSAPEFFTSLSAALEGRGEIAIGNVIGSNIANILIVLGLPALFCSVPSNRPMVLTNTNIMIFASLLLVPMCLYGEISRIFGAVLFACAFGVVVYWIDAARRGRVDNADGETSAGRNGFLLSALQILVAVAAMPLGAGLLVENGAAVARHWGVSEAVIGVSLIAVGTSLPEIAAMTLAAMRKQMELAIGNAIGSNIFNIFFVLGSVALIQPIEVASHFLGFDLWVMLAVSFVLLPFLLGGRDIGKVAGGVFLLCYAGFIFVLTT
ncbi:MAG: calcium/sodium antiporter [Hyphomicrobiales bacterium]|nr:calcium/sodium antiporter [Hyphomicrobiales bacterium]